MALRKVTPDDYQFLYELLKEKTPEQNISHKEIPTWEQHVDFNNKNPYKEDYIIEVENSSTGEISKAGRVYLTHQNEVGIHISSLYRGSGLGTSVLQELINRHYGETIYANIAPSNVRSQQFFTANGFTLVQYTYRLTGN